MSRFQFKNNFKIAVFDLDGTLWNGIAPFDEGLKVLNYLKSCGLRLYIASFHTAAEECCHYMRIAHYFHGFHYGQDRSKLAMIREVLRREENADVAEHEVVFFDDLPSNVEEVCGSSAVRAVKVEADAGVCWFHIPEIFTCELAQ
jgi:predicted phosphatase